MVHGPDTQHRWHLISRFSDRWECCRCAKTKDGLEIVEAGCVAHTLQLHKGNEDETFLQALNSVIKRSKSCEWRKHRA